MLPSNIQTSQKRVTHMSMDLSMPTCTGLVHRPSRFLRFVSRDRIHFPLLRFRRRLSLAILIHISQSLHRLLQHFLPVLTKACHLCHVLRSDVVDLKALTPLARQRPCGHGEPHILWSVDELQDGRGCLIFFYRFDAQDTCVTAGA